MVDEINFEEKMQLAKDGEKQVYEDVLKNLLPLITNFVRKYYYKNLFDVDDLAQEILLAIHQSIHTYDCSRKFKPWVYAIANYKIKDYLRSLYRKKKLNEVNFADVEHAIFDENAHNFEEKEQNLAELLEVLKPKQRKIVKSLKIDGNSLQETANEMNMSVVAVKVASHCAYKVLIKKFGKKS